MKIVIRIIACLLVLTGFSCSAQQSIPDVYSGMKREQGKLHIALSNGRKLHQKDVKEPYALDNFRNCVTGTVKGLAFDFSDPDLAGTLYYGFIHYNDSRHPQPVFFRSSSAILAGRAEVDILNNMSGRYDMIGWEKSGKGTLGYRVVNRWGEIIYDGRVAFKKEKTFEIEPTIIEGPFINLLGHDEVTISFETNLAVRANIIVNGQSYRDRKQVLQHEIPITGLDPDQVYDYTVECGGQPQQYSFRTAPAPGSRNTFTFAYASDSRSGQGGGERDIYGVNAYIMKKIMAASLQHDARFLQFTGDLINGYLSDADATRLQYANWKGSIGAFAHYLPVMVGMGNHEALEYWFTDSLNRIAVRVDRFPFETESAEALFMNNFVMPSNGPDSEDGAVYDPNPRKKDFPSYKESVYYYTYDNIAMVVLNSDYFYSSTHRTIPISSGNLHAYLLDRQLEWLESTLKALEADQNIDHVLVTLHTPVFPNGGHVQDDMWYGGVNDFRPYIAGRPLQQGIIERRDAFLNILVNKSEKVLAVLTGDEHNYNRVKISDGMPRYPDLYFSEKVRLNREIWQINNGAAGAPYYAQEMTPWSEYVEGFTTQTALVLITVEGKKVSMRVINPDTLELIDETVLTE